MSVMDNNSCQRLVAKKFVINSTPNFLTTKSPIEDDPPIERNDGLKENDQGKQHVSNGRSRKRKQEKPEKHLSFNKDGSLDQKSRYLIEALSKSHEPPVTGRMQISIKKKLGACTDPGFNRLEEQEINKRADTYAFTAPADSEFYILPEDAENPSIAQPSAANRNKLFGADSTKELVKRKRRSYNNIDCFVTHSRRDDVDGSQHCLPVGTRLLKPPKKLVELVAQTINSSPDGLLQVHQIYTALQNKFPYFRYMDKSAINSWRSSVRHALYQKWFRKIRFVTETISSKGCFWTINRELSPEEWIVPYNQDDRPVSMSEQEEACATILDMIQGPTVTEEDISKLLDADWDFAELTAELTADGKLASDDLDIPSPVREPDPILVSCVPDPIAATPRVDTSHFEFNEEFYPMSMKLTPQTINLDNTSDGNSTSGSTSPIEDLWNTILGLDDLPSLFSPTYCIHPYGMPAFPDHPN